MNANTPLIDQADLGRHLDAKLVFKFFAAFSRFEYALKASGFVTPNRERAEPDWEEFSRKIEPHFLAQGLTDPELKGALDALVAAPPKKQSTDLRWVDVTPQEPERGARNSSRSTTTRSPGRSTGCDRPASPRQAVMPGTAYRTPCIATTHSLTLGSSSWWRSSRTSRSTVRFSASNRRMLRERATRDGS